MNKCPTCGKENRIVNECRCDPDNLPTTVPATCPICGSVLKPDEVLLARYIPEHEWWVIYHMPARAMTPPDPEKDRYRFDLLKCWCARAGYSMSPVPDKYPNP